MFDKFLCKRIHKKKISLADIGQYLANKFINICIGTLFVILPCGLCVCMYDMYKTDIEAFKVIAGGTLLGITIFGILVLHAFSDDIIVARCPNAKETEEEKKE